MRRVFVTLILVIVVALLPTAEGFAAPPAEAFARLPSFSDLAISPGGKYFVARVNTGNGYSIKIFNFESGGLEVIYSINEDDDLSIAWFEWVSDTTLVASIAFSSKRRARVIVQTQERRLISIDATTSTAIPLFRDHRDEFPVQIQDRVVSFLSDDPDHILVQYSTSDPKSPNVYQVDVRKTKSHKRVLRGRGGVYHWMADAEGDVRLGSGLKKEKTPYLTIRPKAEKKWKDFSHRVNTENSTFQPISFSNYPDKIYVRSNHEGDPLGLYLFDIVTDEFGELIYKHASVDISSVQQDENTAELLSVNFVDDDVETVRFAERPIQERIIAFQQQVGEYDVSTRSVSKDGNFAVLKLSSEADAGAYYLFNGRDNKVVSLPPQYPDLADGYLGRTLASEYEARDGLMIPAYITLPPGYESMEDVDNIPFIIHPHGGPGARDFMRFSFDVQFLVSRGYGVLQMNYRGSTGYGQAFKDAGKREWGQAMQDDITDGVEWLVANNYADPNRVAIVGGSYGGYAALMGVVKTPDLYQCAVSFAGVTDLPDLLARKNNYIGGRYRTRFIGDLWKDRKMLAANSPARRAIEIKVPVLLMHGSDDTVVDIRQSTDMAKQLKKYAKRHRFVEFEKGDHHLSLFKNRLRYLTEMDTFLTTCLNN